MKVFHCKLRSFGNLLTIKRLFEKFMGNPELLSFDATLKTDNIKPEDKEFSFARTVADYIAGMTDRYAIAEHKKIFNSNHFKAIE
jgi:dGTPase